MKIKKDTILDVSSSRKGRYVGIALEDFDVEDEWYPIAVHQEEPVYGANNEWYKGDKIPCRKGLCKIEIHKGIKRFIDVRQFGKDHWSMLAYVESKVVDKNGVLDLRNLSCNPERHAFYQHSGGWDDKYSTRLKEGQEIGHDDFDCLDDLQHAGYITWVPGNIHNRNPTATMTKLGSEVNGRLRAHKAQGDKFTTFEVMN